MLSSSKCRLFPTHQGIQGQTSGKMKRFVYKIVSVIYRLINNGFDKRETIVNELIHDGSSYFILTLT